MEEGVKKGEEEVYIGTPGFDESSQSDAIQISVPLMHNGKATGVLIAGIKLTYLQARYLRSVSED